MEDPKKRLAEIETAMQAGDFWSNKAQAQELVAEYQRLKDELSGEGQYEAGNAVITIFSGAGGDDAEDFSRMLFDMYRKFAERRGFGVQIIHQNENNHGGYRNLTFVVEGSARGGPARPAGGQAPGPYGILKSESGVHRLVRVSPFSAKKLRHTSFSLVEVIPEFSAEGGPASGGKIPDKDLKVEFARSSGPGGQNVNKRETAVRIVHLPTGLAAHAETERSQERNRDRALAILRGKLYKRAEEERQAKVAGMYISKTADIEWGSQIRSYVLHPYKLVKDHRTNVETSDVEGVLNGDLDIFL